MASPGWPALIAAAAVLWLCKRLTDAAERSQRPRIGLSAIWLSERCDRLGRHVLRGDDE
jgi:hypothetical protein